MSFANTSFTCFFSTSCQAGFGGEMWPAVDLESLARAEFGRVMLALAESSPLAEAGPLADAGAAALAEAGAGPLAEAGGVALAEAGAGASAGAGAAAGAVAAGSVAAGAVAAGSAAAGAVAAGSVAAGSAAAGSAAAGSAAAGSAAATDSMAGASAFSAAVADAGAATDLLFSEVVDVLRIMSFSLLGFFTKSLSFVPGAGPVSTGSGAGGGARLQSALDLDAKVACAKCALRLMRGELK